MEPYFSLDAIQWKILVRITVAMVLGAIIGMERELEDKPAGLRTHILVAGAAALFVGMGDVIENYFDTSGGSQILGADPVRIINAVVTGISFLGAGTIIRQRADQRIEGLTTAASVLFTAGLGVAIAWGQILLAAGATVLALFTLRGLGYVEDRMDSQKH